MKSVLLVEDDNSLGEALVELLETKSFNVTWSKSINEAKSALSGGAQFSLLILDIGLPDGSGMDLAKWVKEEIKLPFIFMTAMNTAENRLEGFELGAEEFIPKPFHFKELLMRIDHVLEAHKRAPNVMSVNGVKINFDDQTIEGSKAKDVRLSSRDFALLRLLIEQSPKVLSRDEILDNLVGEDKFPSHRTVDNSIVRIRQVIDDTAGNLVRSVRGVGYQWQEGKDGENS